jgi:ATP-dependent Lon protease
MQRRSSLWECRRRPKKIAEDELRKLETLNEQSPEYNVARTYLETLTSLPWNVETDDILDLDYAEQVLNEDHYGLERVKERILEFLAVKKLTEEHETSLKGSIICLVGPPGVGKTSIGKSIARSLGRNFYRFSLGGMRDEAEIKGHRRTYVGAMPGKVIQAYKRAGSKNPVLMLDEIDKLGRSFQGDPASALLEILDPEQNDKFVDHYLDAPFDLSQTIFVATANDLSTIPEPLLDRMELIEIPGYTLEEKEEIATRYLWPRVLRNHGLKPSQVRVPKKALKQLMLDYAREPGVRTLQRTLERIARKGAAKTLRQKGKAAIVVKADELKEWLGPKRFENDLAERITRPGVLVGLAWTAMGGDILFIEATRTPGSGQLKLTGKMGEVMTESANIAWTYVRRILAEEGEMTERDLKGYDYHLHIPAGAIPKDGPSAGVTMAATLYSLITGRTAKSKLAMTGELSLIGKVLPVGGIKEKLLAAKRSGVTTVILPDFNRKDLDEIPERHIRGLNIHFVKHFSEVLPLVLSSRPSKQASLELEPMPVRLPEAGRSAEQGAQA